MHNPVYLLENRGLVSSIGLNVVRRKQSVLPVYTYYYFWVNILIYEDSVSVYIWLELSISSVI